MNLKEELNNLKDQGLITLRPNSDNTLLIANYTPKVQYDRLWTDTLKICRGLIVDNEYNIVGRPFQKFFNLEEHQSDEIPNEPFQVFDKMDGSLGICFHYDGKWQIATRGSFNSEQAVKANEMLNTKYVDWIEYLHPNFTYLFEIIYPENRIICDYGKDEKLVLLAVINTKDGEDTPLFANQWPDIVQRYNGVNSLDKIKYLENDTKEGVVLKFKSGFRVKCKFSEYVRLHKIITQVSSKSIWEYLSDGTSFNELLERVPDEFYNWVKKTVADLNGQHVCIFKTVNDDFLECTIDALNDRKLFAEYAKSKQYPHLLFAFLDNKDVRQMIWKMIKPQHEKPFKIEI